MGINLFDDDTGGGVRQTCADGPAGWQVIYRFADRARAWSADVLLRVRTSDMAPSMETGEGDSRFSAF